MLRGLWAFPRSDTAPGDGRVLGEIVYRYTHFTLYATLLECALPPEMEASVRYVAPEALEELPMSRLDREIARRFFFDGSSETSISSLSTTL